MTASSSITEALAALPGGLVVRVLGDLAGREGLRSAGGIAKAVSIGLFAMVVIYARVARPVSARAVRRPISSL